MRILAIRGKNLASLSRLFEVDFMAAPLVDTGIFAITGPTGAGKSTLLDALCLALYDDTPRLLRATGRGASLPDVQNETLAVRDSRNILRRGATEGFAEVDFAGNDGQGYRARWSARRARNKAEGKLQAVDMSLLRLSDLQPVGGALKTEVLSAIRERIGLSFEQFTRAVLLAQNEFAAFLKASDDERAELLQTLTGTDQFADLSRRAFERAREEKNRLQGLLEASGQVQPLATEARAQLEAEAQAAQQLMQAHEQQRAALERQLHWHEQLQTLQTDEAAAAERVQQALKVREAARERSFYLMRVQAVQPARAHQEAGERSAGELTAAQQALEQAQRGLQQADAELLTATTRQVQLAGQLTAAEQARQQAEPELKKARELDIQMAALLPGHTAAQQALQAAQATRQEAARLFAQKTAEHQAAADALTALDNWLSAQAHRQVLGERWEQWQAVFEQAGREGRDVAALEQTLARLRKDERTHQQAHDQAQITVREQETATRAAQQALDAANAALQAFDPDDIARQRQALETAREQLDRGKALWQAYEQARQRLQEVSDRHQASLEEAAHHTQGLQTVREQQTVAESVLAQAERSVQLAADTCHETAESLRARLEPDQPCPVCGATEHPYAGQAPRMRVLLDGLQQEAQRCQQQVRTLAERAATEQAGLSHARQQADTLARELAKRQPELEQHTARWQAVSDSLTSEEVVWPEWFEQQLAAQRSQQQTLQAHEQAWHAASRTQAQAQQQWQQAQQHWQQGRDTLAQALLVLRQSTQALAATVQQHEAADGRLHDELQQLQAAFSGTDWIAAWRADPAGFAASCRTEAQQWMAQKQAQAALQPQLAVLTLEQSAGQADAERAQRQLQQAQEHFARLDADMQERRSLRATYCGGREVAEQEHALQADVQAATEALARHQQQHSAATGAQVRAAETVRHAQQGLTVAQDKQVQVEAVLQAWLAAFNASVAERWDEPADALPEQPPVQPLDQAGLRALLAHDAGWIQAETQAMRALDEAISQADILLRERADQRAKHAAQGDGASSQEQVQRQHAETLTRLEQARSHWQELQLRLRQDNERLERSAGLRAGIAAQEAVNHTWQQLNELIGSADGKKFRNFAQQYSLDVLLGYANRHLGDLSRRYVLRRVPDSLALLVLDQDMGNETRSVHSLSGGESFLLSLALALGLASLSSQRVRVESLFIDEGFGSLDADSLRIAMDALDNLQAMGRKVGVISHVQEMTERIGVQIQVKRLAGGQSRLQVV